MNNFSFSHNAFISRLLLMRQNEFPWRKGLEAFLSRSNLTTNTKINFVFVARVDWDQTECIMMNKALSLPFWNLYEEKKTVSCNDWVILVDWTWLLCLFKILMMKWSDFKSSFKNSFEIYFTETDSRSAWFAWRMVDQKDINKVTCPCISEYDI